MISEHFAAIKARIEAGSGLAGKVFDTLRYVDGGGVAREQYVILYRSAPRVDSDRLSAVPVMTSLLRFDVDVRVIGTSPTAVSVTAERVMDQLVGHRLAVAGRMCSPLTVEETGPVLTDTSVKDFLYMQDLSFEFVSEPA